MSSERKCHGAQHVCSACKVAVDNKLLSSVSDDDIGMSVTVDALIAASVQLMPSDKEPTPLNVSLNFSIPSEGIA